MSNIFAVSSLVSFPHFIFINNVSCTFPLPQVSFLLTLSSSYFLSCIIFWFVLARFSTFHYLFHFFFTFSDVLTFIFCYFFYVLLLSILYICYLIFPTHISFLHPSCYVFSSSYCFSPIYFPPSTSTVFFATLHFYIFPYFLFLPLFHICFLPFFPFSHFLSFSPALFCFLFSSPAFSQWRINNGEVMMAMLSEPHPSYGHLMPTAVTVYTSMCLRTSGYVQSAWLCVCVCIIFTTFITLVTHRRLPKM